MLNLLSHFAPWFAVFVIVVACSQKPKQVQKPESVQQRAGVKMPDQNEEIIDFTEASQTVETVLFDLNSSNVKNSPELVEAASYAHVTGLPVHIVGHACPLGEDDLNMVLGMRRAAAVKSSLIAQGVNREKISIDSKGETQPITNDPDEYAQNRRAEITIGGL